MFFIQRSSRSAVSRNANEDAAKATTLQPAALTSCTTRNPFHPVEAKLLAFKILFANKMLKNMFLFQSTSSVPANEDAAKATTMQPAALTLCTTRNPFHPVKAKHNLLQFYLPTKCFKTCFFSSQPAQS